MRRAHLFFMTGALAATAIGLFAVWSTTAPLPAIAQTGGVIDTVLYDQIGQLETRFMRLENDWRQFSTLPGPFRVIDEAGMELATIRAGAGGLPELRVGPGIVADYVDGNPALRVEAGARQAGLRIEGDTATVFASSDGVNGFVASSASSGEHLASIYAGGNEVANLGVTEGRHAAVRFFDSEANPRAALGMDMDGLGQLRVIEPASSSGVTIGGDGHNGGNVRVWHLGQEAVSMRTATGSGAVTVYGVDGTPVGFITSVDGGGGLIAVNDAGGTEAVHFTFRDAGGSFCVRLQNGNAQCLLPLPR